MINLINDEKILSEMIENFKSQGFDQIRLPGGTSKSGSFYSGVISPKYDAISKRTYFAVVPYNSKYFLEGEGNHNKSSDETPEQTALRELFEETGISTSEENLVLAWESLVPDNRPWRMGEIHMRRFYLVDEFDDSNFFTFEGANPINAETLAPIWVSANLIVKVIFSGHKKAICEAIDKLIQKNMQYAWSMMSLSK